MQFWREAHCACQFARILNAQAIRICEIDPPDFELKCRGEIMGCELVEIRNPSERIGQEFDYAAASHNAGTDPPVVSHDIEAHRRWLFDRLETCIGNKSRKGYDSRFILAVFVHAWIFEHQGRDTDRVIFDAVRPHLDAFSEIWVLSSGRLLSFKAQQDPMS